MKCSLWISLTSLHWLRIWCKVRVSCGNGMKPDNSRPMFVPNFLGFESLIVEIPTKHPRLLFQWRTLSPFFAICRCFKNSVERLLMSTPISLSGRRVISIHTLWALACFHHSSRWAFCFIAAMIYMVSTKSGAILTGWLYCGLSFYKFKSWRMENLLWHRHQGWLSDEFSNSGRHALSGKEIVEVLIGHSNHAGTPLLNLGRCT